MGSRHRRRHQMYPLIESYLAGSQSERAFCSEHGLTRSVFAHWRAKYRRDMESSEGAFREIHPPAGYTGTAQAEIEYPNGVRVRFFGSVDAGLLLKLVSERRAA